MPACMENNKIGMRNRFRGCIDVGVAIDFRRENLRIDIKPRNSLKFPIKRHLWHCTDASCAAKSIRMH